MFAIAFAAFIFVKLDVTDRKLVRRIALFMLFVATIQFFLINSVLKDFFGRPRFYALLEYEEVMYQS